MRPSQTFLLHASWFGWASFISHTIKLYPLYTALSWVTLVVLADYETWIPKYLVGRRKDVLVTQKFWLVPGGVDALTWTVYVSKLHCNTATICLVPEDTHLAFVKVGYDLLIQLLFKLLLGVNIVAVPLKQMRYTGLVRPLKKKHGQQIRFMQQIQQQKSL